MPETPLTLEALGGTAAVETIVARFYEKVYAHPQLSPLFAAVDQQRQRQRLAGFIRMTIRDGWMSGFNGRYLRDAHAHLGITDALFDLRQSLLQQAILEHGADEQRQLAWMTFDDRWRVFVVHPDSTPAPDAKGRGQESDVSPKPKR